MARVSVGVPVRNGGDHLDDALRALRAQTYREISIVVCDNASTDHTPKICEKHAVDPRLTVHRWERDVGASENFNRAFQLSEGAFFMWAAHDDWIEPNYISRCLEVLERKPEAAGCVTSVQLRAPRGKPLRVARESRRLSSHDLGVRLQAYLRRDQHWWYHVYGLYRRQALAETGLFRGTYGPDVLLVWEVLLDAPLEVVDEPLLSYRTNPNKTVDQTMAGIRAESDGGSRAAFVHLAMWRRMWSLADERANSSRALRTARLELIRCLAHERWRAMFALDFGREAMRRWNAESRLPQRVASIPAVSALTAIAVLLAPIRVLSELRREVQQVWSESTLGDDP